MTVAGLPQNIREKCRESNLTAKSVLLEIARQFDEAAMNEFLKNITKQNLNREKIRQTARPPKPVVNQQQKFTSNKFSNDSNKTTKTTNPGVYKYKSPGDNFNLEIEFVKSSHLDKNIVLKALKETFEKVKTSGLE